MARLGRRRINRSRRQSALELAPPIGFHPRPQPLEFGTRREDVGIGIAPADDLHADRQAVSARPAGTVAAG